jgi:hypothetical protein
VREVPLSWVSSMELGWALLWRFLLIAIPLNLAIQQLPSGNDGIGAVLELTVLIGSVTSAVHWARATGFRRYQLRVLAPDDPPA